MLMVDVKLGAGNREAWEASQPATVLPPKY